MTAETVFDVAPPTAPDAEAALLGACLLSLKAVEQTCDWLTPSDFYLPAHQHIWRAIQAVHGNGDRPDPITVAAALPVIELKRIGGGYLADLYRDCPTASNATHYAALVSEAATRRRILVASERIAQAARAGRSDLAGFAETLLDEACKSRTETSARHVSDLLEAAVDALDSDAPTTGIPTGYLALDRGHGLGMLKPLEPGQLIVIAGRTSQGKSVVARDIVRHTAVTLGLSSLLVSMEMSEPEVTRALIAAQSGVSLNAMDTRDLTEDDWVRVARATDRLSKAPLFVDDSGEQTLATIRRLVRQVRPRLLVVDYLQLMSSSERSESRQLEIATFTRGLKILAKAEQIPVVALSQVNRAPTARQDKRPHLSDLRESGAIEQDADTVILLHRPEADDPNDRQGEIDLHVAKQRGGATGVATLAAQLHLGRLVDLSRTLL